MDPVIACVDISMTNTAIVWFRPLADRSGGWEPFRWQLIQPKLPKEKKAKLKVPQKEVILCRQLTAAIHDALPGTPAIAVELYTGSSRSISGTKSLVMATTILAGFAELHPESEVVWIPQGRRLVRAFGDPRKSERKVTKERIMCYAEKMFPWFVQENRKDFISKTSKSGFTQKYEHVADACLLMGVVMEDDSLFAEKKRLITETQTDAPVAKRRTRRSLRCTADKDNASNEGRPVVRRVRRR